MANITKFLLEKVPKTFHFVNSLDGQPVQDSAVAGQTTVMVQVSPGDVLCLGQFFFEANYFYSPTSLAFLYSTHHI